MEENAVCSSNLECRSRAGLAPRRYQLEIFLKARDANTIVCLETGAGKTRIAAMLLEELSYLFSSSVPCIAVFLVPTVMLVQQQASAIEMNTSLKVGQYNGQNDSMKWDLKKWNDDIYNLEVLVMTPQILLNVLQHAMIKMEAIKVLVFDECHHCQKNHPYALIMEEFYFKMEVCKRPRILGMTASPVIRKGKSELQCTQDINSLERMLDAKILTAEDRTDLDSIVPRPVIRIKQYDRVYYSLERLQSIVKIINTVREKSACQPTQALCHTNNEGNDTQKKERDVLGKICRDLEYCIYDLGLWFARHAASDVYALEKRSMETHDLTQEGGKDLLLRELYECLDQMILQDGYKDELRVDCRQPDLVSNKVAALVDVLINFRHSQQKCIVFVERVVAAKVLANFLSGVLKPLRCEHIVGGHSKMGSPSRNQMSKTIRDFRSGSVHLLVATNVAEEGVDIQDCNLIVQFDMPKTLRSFIQSRGRARVQSSHYVILADMSAVSVKESLDLLISSEKFVIESISQGHNFLTNSKAMEEIDTYKVESTGALVNCHSSIQLLHHYCSKLPRDQFFHPQPSFLYVKEYDGVKCHLTLPSNACIRLVEGEFCDTEATARQSVCLKACKLLHLKGALTDYLLPQTSTGEASTGFASNPHSAKAELEDLQEFVLPAVWSQKPTNTCGLICLQAYRITFKAVHGDQEYSTFALLLRSSLPENAAKFSETFQLRRQRAVSCEIAPLKEVFLSQFQVMQAEKFQSTVFSVLLDRNLEHSKSKEQLMADGPWYLLVPLKKDVQLSFGQDPEIDWERISELQSFQESNHGLNLNESAPLKVDGTDLQFSNGVLHKKNVPGLLVKTLNGKALYCIIDIFPDLNAESPFPSSRYKDYVDYYESMYNHELVYRRQHLLKARFLREVYNFSLIRSSKERASDVSCSSGKYVTKDISEERKSVDNLEKSIVELPPEVCTIEYFGFYDDLVNAAVILPSLMHRIESILVATQFHNFLSSKFDEGSLVSVGKILEATTTQKCMEYFSLERLELLGDSFLKYAVSCNLFLVHEEADEGFLSVQRVKKVCNSMLFALGKNIGLIEYIHDGFFHPKNWVAPCYPAKALCAENNIRDLHGESSKANEGKPFVTCNKQHRWMQRKTVADAIEALIGAYLEDGGERAALSFMKFIGLDVGVDTLQVIRVQSLSKANLSLIKRIDVEAIENLLSYKFKYKGILIEAFTHASFSNHLGKCYQRLEFLGDSVLDFLITKHLYKEFKYSKPGDLTDLRSTIVSNESFARIVIEKKVFRHLIESSVELSKCIEEYISYLNNLSEHEITGDWDGDKCPKVLGDILESLSGAVFVDGGFDLNLVWEVFAPMLQPLISAGRRQLHPVRELLETCQKNHFSYDTSLQKGDNQCQFKFQVNVNDQVIIGTATSKDKKSAKRQAALDAISKLKIQGYTHGSRCQSSGSQEMRNMDSTLSQGNPCKSKTSSILASIDKNSAATDSSSTFLLHNVDNVSSTVHHEGMEDKSILDRRSEQLLRIDPWDKFTEMGIVPGRMPVSVVNHHRISSSSQSVQHDEACDSNEPCSVLSQSDDNSGHRRKHVGSLQGRSSVECSNASRLDAQGPLGTHLRHEHINYTKPCGDIEQSSEGTSSSECGAASSLDAHVPVWTPLREENINDSKHIECTEQSSDTPDDLVERPSLSKVHDIDMTKRLGLLSVSGSVTPPNIASTIQVDPKGLPRTQLYEVCARNKWKDPSFTCSKEEGPPHDKWFTYDVILQLPRVGQVRCNGDPKRKAKAAMDSAAAELLNWLESEGYL